jgi:2-dehydro-3-deoxygalactonokinase
LAKSLNVSEGRLIAADWGTSRLRAALLDSEGNTLAEAESDEGIGAIDGGHDAVFRRLTSGWPAVPAIMAGMVGSRQGWREVSYVPCPATPATLADMLFRFKTEDGRAVAIVPGVMLRARDRDGDVMRGEETQILGLIDRAPNFVGTVVLPGTHSKWVRVEDRTIIDFQTFLAGEMFDLLANRSFLRHSVAKTAGDLAASPDFALAIERVVQKGLPFLAAIFSVRARQLLDNVVPADNLAYLSGLVIGGEIAAAKSMGHLLPGEALSIVGSASLASAYQRAFALLGHDAKTFDGKALAVSGLIRLAKDGGLAEIGRGW